MSQKIVFAFSEIYTAPPGFFIYIYGTVTVPTLKHCAVLVTVFV